MSAHTVNISFQNELLEQIDSIAKEESRSRSEIIRESARMYIKRKKRWKTLFAIGEYLQTRNGITEQDIIEEIRAVRSKK
jgi:metal-responsive CopG/Arc/MetJ family transcriptional regulator